MRDYSTPCRRRAAKFPAYPKGNTLARVCLKALKIGVLLAFLGLLHTALTQTAFAAWLLGTTTGNQDLFRISAALAVVGTCAGAIVGAETQRDWARGMGLGLASSLVAIVFMLALVG